MYLQEIHFASLCQKKKKRKEEEEETIGESFTRILIIGLKLEKKIRDLHEGLKENITPFKSEPNQVQGSSNRT